jgi:CheY-like chemotaxis protein
VLYVEDNPANLKLVELILRRRPDLQLLSAPNAILGLELAIGHRPDLILLDINLPGMSGYEMLERLQATPALAQTPVIAVSANALPRDVAQGLEAGFLAYLTKPIRVRELLDVLDTYLP